ncbi:hypothetical protein PsorP6_003937 [Peronosclerospora sorghi]|uniref:Uncharacterized protein n=1 Tax=Peronosclerospora sorghi TaxID=230839 RepID=A0ACC0VLZ6_9STRA|nr:hypothetical protein PsorP6_003937 [Peronosclerospora sorghi]
MAPIRLTLKRSKKRLKHGNKAKMEPLCIAFKEENQEQENNVMRVKHRVEVLEDVHGKVKRLKDEGNILAEAGRFRAAMSRWKEALSVDPDNAALYELLAQASMAIYEDFQAIQFARKATELAPQWSDGFLTLSRCQLNFGELSLAWKALKKAVELNRGIETEEMASDRQDIEKLLAKQEQILRMRDDEAAHEVESDKLQVITCFKHLTLRGQATNGSSNKESN